MSRAQIDSKRISSPVQLDNDQLARFDGKFEYRGQSFELKVENDSLFQFIGGRRRLHLIPESRFKLFAGNKSDLQFKLQVDENGSQKSFLILYGVKGEALVN